MKILIVGGGNMGRTYAQSFVAGRAVERQNLFILERAQEKVPALKALGFESVFAVPGPFVAEADLLILAVKPQDTASLFPTLASHMRKEQLVLSIMAGTPVATIKAALPTSKIVRAMPNLPAQIGMGMTGFTADPSVTRTELFAAQNLLNTTGKSLYFDDEDRLDAVTAISGSGPAYVFYFMQAMIDKALLLGFSASEAETLVEQTFMGAVHLQNNSGSCKEWIAKVASRGGTTEAALATFGKNGLSECVAEGLQAALERARELGGGKRA